MTGDAAILALKYAEGSTGPETIVLKYAKDLEANRVLAQEANMYEKETFFYRELHRSAAAAAVGSARRSAPNAALPLAQPRGAGPARAGRHRRVRRPREAEGVLLHRDGGPQLHRLRDLRPDRRHGTKRDTQPSPSQRSCAALTLAVGARRTACCWRRMWGAFTRSSGTMSSSSTR